MKVTDDKSQNKSDCHSQSFQHFNTGQKGDMSTTGWSALKFGY